MMKPLKTVVLAMLTPLFVVACSSDDDKGDPTLNVKNTVYLRVEDENGKSLDPDELLQANRFAVLGKQNGKLLDVKTETIGGDKMLVFSSELPMKGADFKYQGLVAGKGTTRSGGENGRPTFPNNDNARQKFFTGAGTSAGEITIDDAKVPLTFHYSFYADVSHASSIDDLKDTDVELNTVYSDRGIVVFNSHSKYCKIILRKDGQGYRLIDPNWFGNEE